MLCLQYLLRRQLQLREREEPLTQILQRGPKVIHGAVDDQEA